MNHDLELNSKDSFKVSLQKTMYAQDSTAIDFFLALFNCARFRTHKGVIILYTLLDILRNFTSFIAITNGKVHDFNIVDVLMFKPVSFYILNCGYLVLDSVFLIKKSKGSLS